MGAYFATYIQKNEIEESINLVVEQGQEIQKDGRVMVQVKKKMNYYDVEITGNAVYVKNFNLKLD